MRFNEPTCDLTACKKQHTFGRILLYAMLFYVDKMTGGPKKNRFMTWLLISRQNFDVSHNLGGHSSRIFWDVTGFTMSRKKSIGTGFVTGIL